MTPEEIQTILDELFQSEGSDFTYTSEGRSDPFVPFVTDSSQSSSAKSDDVVLIGLRKYEPGQLQLVAIVFAENDPIAMVQDSLGKGYILHRGTKIGRTGEVEDISPNVITIKQMVSTPTRKQRYKTIEMILRKEGDKRQ
ncbi:MAG: pilus assembly protein PilP [Proteobacteria bacterium]|nr:pilus assembly protein PilP [Pseudomonadota bacterium]MBU1709109.1 pilus assembly protein PilP [Pseudomonadota bacterium]